MTLPPSADKRIHDAVRTPSDKEREAVITLMAAVAVLIRSLRRVPSGVLYMRLGAMIPNLTLDSYEGMVSKLLDAKLIERKSHELIWIGPQAPPEV